MDDDQNDGHGDVERDVQDVELCRLRELMTARLLSTNKLAKAIEHERQLLATGNIPAISIEQPLTVDEANKIAEGLTGGSMHVVETQGRMELRGAGAGSGVLLPIGLTSRSGIAAAVMEFYR